MTEMAHWGDGTPLPYPPAWPEQEWCDEGATCGHDACIWYAWEVAIDETHAASDCDHRDH